MGSIALEHLASQVGCGCCAWAVAGGGITAPMMILEGTAHHGKPPGSCNVPAPACSRPGVLEDSGRWWAFIALAASMGVRLIPAPGPSWTYLGFSNPWNAGHCCSFLFSQIFIGVSLFSWLTLAFSYQAVCDVFMRVSHAFFLPSPCTS